MADVSTLTTSDNIKVENPLVRGVTLYWVGGDGSWSDKAHWSLYSGGDGGDGVPTSDDNVVFDENSDSGGSFSINMGACSIYCKNFDASSIDQSMTLNIDGGWLGTCALHLYGDFVGSSLLNVKENYKDKVQDFRLYGSDNTITTNSCLNSCGFRIMSGASYKLNDDLGAIKIHVDGGVFDFNDYDKTGSCDYTYSSDIHILNNGTMYLGGGSIKVNQFYVESGSLYCGTSSITLDGSYSWIIGLQSDFYNITANDYANIKIKSANSITTANNTEFHNGFSTNTFTANAGDTIKFESGYTFKSNSWSISGVSGNLITIRSITDGSQYTLDGNNNSITADYVDIKDSNVVNGPWNIGDGFVDSGNNTGWAINQNVSVDIDSISILNTNILVFTGILADIFVDAIVLTNPDINITGGVGTSTSLSADFLSFTNPDVLAHILVTVSVSPDSQSFTNPDVYAGQFVTAEAQIDAVNITNADVDIHAILNWSKIVGVPSSWKEITI